jgi:hypothetical protein
MNTETIFEAALLTFLLAIVVYWLRPFTWESAQREAEREWKAGNENAHVTGRWYGWVVVHKTKLKEHNKGEKET